MGSNIGSAHRPTAAPGVPIVAVAVTAVVASLLIACTGATGASPGATAGPSDPGSRPSGPVSVPPSGDAVPGTVPATLLEAIVADASAIAGVDAGDVIVISTESVTWNDGSLGCPKPGVMYIQQIIAGYRVVVEAGGERYDYRAGSSGEPKRCEGSLPSGGSS